MIVHEITQGKEIDLGLPSGTIWAAWNVGATSPDEHGDYYAWGETTTKEVYNKEAYKYNDEQTGENINIESDISGTKYDVARQEWGGSWRMPTKAEIAELVSNCEWTRCQYKGVNGYKVTGPNGNNIFLPAAGFRFDTSLCFDGIEGRYWSATLTEGEGGDYNLAWYLNFERLYCSEYLHDYWCFHGHSIRPVKSATF